MDTQVWTTHVTLFPRDTTLTEEGAPSTLTHAGERYNFRKVTKMIKGICLKRQMIFNKPVIIKGILKICLKYIFHIVKFGAPKFKHIICRLKIQSVLTL